MSIGVQSQSVGVMLPGFACGGFANILFAAFIPGIPDWVGYALLYPFFICLFAHIVIGVVLYVFKRGLAVGTSKLQGKQTVNFRCAPIARIGGR